jgi:hypothetical protein
MVSEFVAAIGAVRTDDPTISLLNKNRSAAGANWARRELGDRPPHCLKGNATSARQNFKLVSILNIHLELKSAPTALDPLFCLFSPNLPTSGLYSP